MKKRDFLAVLSAILVMAITLTSLAVPSFARRKLGDVDGDGNISSADARLALRASVKLETLSAEEKLAADVDGDTFVTSADARLILRASVRLETLPEIYFGDATPSDATPSDAETSTEPETPSEPETTTLPEQPSEPETTTLPEQPSEPETTTEPEQPPQPGDFIPPAYNNEFDILRSGTYYFTGSTVDTDGRNDLEIAKTDDTLFLCAKFSGVKIAVLTIGDKVYLVNPEKNLYLDLNTAVMKAEMKTLGVDVNEFANTGSFDFSFFPPLDHATRSETVPGGYVKYVFEAADGAINVTMDGRKLICLENARNGSVYRIDFTMVTDQVPSEKRELKNLKNAVLQSVFVSSLLS